MLLMTHTTYIKEEYFVTFLPDFKLYEKQIILAAADVFVSPADNVQESFGLTVIEAMAQGCAVVASSWSGYRDIVQHGVTGYLVPTLIDSLAVDRFVQEVSHCETPRAEARLAMHTLIDRRRFVESLELLLGDITLCTEFGEAGRERVRRRFPLSACANSLVALWRTQLAQKEVIPTGMAFSRNLAPSFGVYADRAVDFDGLQVHCPTLTLTAVSKEPGMAHILGVLRFVHLRPTSVRRICQECKVPREHVILWLKRGLLELCDEDAS